MGSKKKTKRTTKRHPHTKALKFIQNEGSKDNLTHYLFRYPAKFHPPVVRAILQQYTKRGQTIFDPFVGSGTLLVEAARSGRHAIGMDVDPIAVAVASAKVHRFHPTKLLSSAEKLLNALERFERSTEEYERRQFIDLSAKNFKLQKHAVAAFVPNIPNIEHWFRKYVIVDLARIRKTISKIDVPSSHCEFFKIVLASIIRNASNADPVPVSGLEVTAHMRRRDAEGRVINPFMLFKKSLEKAVSASQDFYQATDLHFKVRVVKGDATNIRTKFSHVPDAVVTSPPYQGAVDYYRRHKLEMFWLGFTDSQSARLKLLDQYIGRSTVRMREAETLKAELKTTLARRWERRMRRISPQRANAFIHYMTSMARVFERLAHVLKKGSPAIIVVGNSTWNGTEVPTSVLFREIAGDHFSLQETLSYPIKNRYMSYSRHNKANIRKEYVLVMKRTAAPAQ